MTTPDAPAPLWPDDLADWLMDFLRDELPKRGPITSSLMIAGKAQQLAALRAERDEAQPVAWRWRDAEQSDWIVQPVEPLRAGVEKEPLYAHPPASPGAAVLEEAIDALTNEQRLSLLSNWCHACGGPAPCRCWDDE
jgi:hypothetical protein